MGDGRTYCRYCFVYNDDWVPRCPACGRCGAMLPVGLTPSVGIREGHRSLADIDADKGERVSMGIPHLDDVLGHDWNAPSATGLRVPSLVLLSGAPGCGKSTLAVTAAARAGVQTLYLATEQSLEEIRETADRCALTRREMERVHIEPAESLRQAIKLMRERRARVVVLDSLTELMDPDHDTGDFQANVTRTAIALSKEASAHRRGIIATAQVNKVLDLVGLKRLEHAAGALMRFEPHGQDMRLLHCPTKNRFGRTGVQRWFVMGDRGLQPCAPPPDPVVEGSSATA